MLFQLFYIFFKIGAFTIGGGYAMIRQDIKMRTNQSIWCESQDLL